MTDGSGGSGSVFRVGLIADTHGFLPTAAEAAFAGVDAIIHAGDVGEGYVLDLLQAIAPVIAVRGNNRYAVEEALPTHRTALLGGITVAIAHRLNDFPHGKLPAAAKVFVYGHTHKPTIETHDGVLWVNPGSTTEPRARADGSKHPTVALLTVPAGGTPTAEIVSVG